MKKTYTYWTSEMILLEAKKFQTRKEFKKSSQAAYAAMERKGKEFRDKCCEHMTYLKEKNKYTNEELIKIGGQYDTPKDFEINCPNESATARYRKVHSQIKFKKGKWPLKYTREEVLELASEYDTAIDLCKRNRPLYRYVERYKLFKEIKYKVGSTGNKLIRMVYVYEFPDNHFYCGLTYNDKVRHTVHMRKGPVYEHIQKTNLTPILIKKSSYISAHDAGVLEENIRLSYIEKGWVQLNRRICGGLGSVREKWNKDKIMKLALNFQFVSRFKNKHMGAYNAAKSMGIYDEVTKHMIKPRRKEDIIELAKKYLCVKDFKKDHPDIYRTLICYGWNKEIFSNHIKHCRVIIVNKTTGIFYYNYYEAYRSKFHKMCLQEFQRCLKGVRANTTDFLLV